MTPRCAAVQARAEPPRRSSSDELIGTLLPARFHRSHAVVRAPRHDLVRVRVKVEVRLRIRVGGEGEGEGEERDGEGSRCSMVRSTEWRVMSGRVRVEGEGEGRG